MNCVKFVGCVGAMHRLASRLNRGAGRLAPRPGFGAVGFPAKHVVGHLVSVGPVERGRLGPTAPGLLGRRRPQAVKGAEETPAASRGYARRGSTAPWGRAGRETDGCTGCAAPGCGAGFASPVATVLWPRGGTIGKVVGRWGIVCWRTCARTKAFFAGERPRELKAFFAGERPRELKFAAR